MESDQLKRIPNHSLKSTSKLFQEILIYHQNLNN